jgi:hypothetical protein
MTMPTTELEADRQQALRAIAHAIDRESRRTPATLFVISGW